MQPFYLSQLSGESRERLAVAPTIGRFISREHLCDVARRKVQEQRGDDQWDIARRDGQRHV